VASYVPVWCKSNFSFLEGTSHPEELIEQASSRDIGPGTYRSGWRLRRRACSRKAREIGFKLIIGSDVTVQDSGALVLLAQNKNGYSNLCRLITKSRLRSEKGESAAKPFYERNGYVFNGAPEVRGRTLGDFPLVKKASRDEQRLSRKRLLRPLSFSVLASGLWLGRDTTDGQN
jgi:hypothetical protein